MPKWIKCVWVGAACLGLAFPAGAAVDEHFVWTNSTASAYPFTSWNSAAHTVQAAVWAANTGDVVWVTNGTYILSQTLNITTNVCTLRSVNGRDYTTLQMDLSLVSNRCVYLTTTGTVDGFTIKNGRVDSGAGISANGGRVFNCLITSNTSASSGPVYLLGGAIMTNCIISFNEVTVDSGDYGAVRMGGIARITDCIISNNGSIGGSGCGLNMRNVGGYASNCIITHNRGLGPSLAVFPSSTGEYCVVKNNSAGNQTQAAYVPGGVLRNSLICDNNISSYDYRASGLYITTYGLVENCIISNNWGGNYGAGVRINGGGTLRNCLVVGNGNGGNSGGGIYFESFAGGVPSSVKI